MSTPKSCVKARLTSSKKRNKLTKRVSFLSDRSSGEVDKSLPPMPDRSFSNPTFHGTPLSL